LIRRKAASTNRLARPVAARVSRNYRQGMAFRIGLPNTNRRAFWARLYARRRLMSALAAPFAPAHYALIGEKLGYRPNAFFDPHYFRDRAGIARNSSRGLLALYLAHSEANAPSPSAEFDHAWYVSQNPDWMLSHPHPFLHFLERGLRNGRRPRQDIRARRHPRRAPLPRGGGLPRRRRLRPWPWPGPELGDGAGPRSPYGPPQRACPATLR
jgi:hypothetical protein